MSKKIFALSLILAAAVIIVGVFKIDNKEVQAGRIMLKDGDLYLVREVFGEKRLTTSGNINILLDEKDDYILVGKGVYNRLPESEMTGGTMLFLLSNDGKTERKISDKIVKGAFFDPTGKFIFYVTTDQNLYVADVNGATNKVVREKIIGPDLSPDGKFMVYVKLNDDWQIGDYYEKALGIAILNLETGEENFITMISETSADFAPLWTPDGKQILFFSGSPEGLASHFIVNRDGSGRTQFTNISERFVSDRTVDIPSEKPIWATNDKGNFVLVYESDYKIWVNIIDGNAKKMIKAKRIAYGIGPKWVKEGKIISIIATEAPSRPASIIKIDLDGNIIKK